MKTKTIELFQFNELSDKAKARARDWWREALSDTACEQVTETLEMWLSDHDCKIDKQGGPWWDVDRAAFVAFNGQWMDKAGKWWHVKTAQGRLYSTRAKIVAEYDCPEELEAPAQEELDALMHEACTIARAEFEYLGSDEAADDGILANEFWFTADGAIDH